MMKLKNMFAKDIGRDIKGVIKVGQDDQENAAQELEEYVVTKELSGHFSKFFDAYKKGINGYTDEMGVWISGFFGSGKSHLLKILSYLLDNKDIKGKKAYEYFDEEKIKDSMLRADIHRAGQVPADVILFNIDAKSDYGTGGSKEAILKVFVKVFYEKQGLFGSKPWIAEMERQLIKEGVYEAFKEEIRLNSGQEWEEKRRNILLHRDLIVNALVKSRGVTRESALEWFKTKDGNFTVSIEDFARMVKEYIAEKGNDHHVVFLVDEVGQYIGDNTQMMLDLQTIVEELGTKCKGKAWVIVTSQEDIDAVTKQNNLKGRDFSKIQGRFKTRINLSSANVDEVIKKRLLEKTPAARDTLSLLYDESCAKLKNTISFAAGTPEMKNFNAQEDFIDVYPFIPYQFNLLQKVFSGIRKHGSSGKHLAEGERSLLSAFQESAQRFGDKDLGTLIPFSLFYNSIESFLDGSIRRVIDQARENSRLHNEDIETLKLLFMIKYVDEMPAKLENIATLLVTKIDEDKIALKGRIEKSLRLLVEETLVQKNGDNYIFLTDDEQDVNREIKNIYIEPTELINKVGDVIFGEIYENKKFRYNSRYDFSFNQQIDDTPRGRQDGEIGIRILTPYFDVYDEYGEQELKALAFGGSTVIMKLPPDNRFLDEIEEYMRVESYIKKTNSVKLPENIQDIVAGKHREQRERKDRILSLIGTAIAEAEIYINGEKVELKTGLPKEKMDQAFGIAVENIYTKLNYVKKFVSSNSDLWEILTEDDRQIALNSEDPNKLALEEVSAYLGRAYDRNIRVTMKMILDHFKAAPFGWKEIDIAAQVARLFKKQDLKLQYAGDFLSVTDQDIPNYLTKRSEVEKLVVIKRISVDPELLMKARIMGRDIFDRTQLAPDEDSLKRNLRDLLTEELASVNDYMSHYQYGRYPGKSSLDSLARLLKELSNIKDTFEFFQTLSDREETLKKAMQDVKRVKGFFKNQKPHFDKGVKVLEIFQENETYVLDKEISEIVAKIRSIIENPSPYGEIMQLPGLTEQFNNRFGQLLREKCTPIRRQIEADFAQVRVEMSKHTLEEGLKKEIRSNFEKLLDKIDQANNFYKAIAMKTESEILKARSFNLIDEALREAAHPDLPLVPGENDDSEPISEPPIKVTQHVNLSELTRNLSLISTEEEVDIFLKDLGEKLKKYLRENKKIQFI